MNNKDTCIYKMYNKDNVCIYVGITNDMKVRMSQHKNDKEWFNEVNRIEHSEYMNRNEAKIFEIYYISKLNPIYNDDHSLFVEGFSLVLGELEFSEYSFKKIIDNELTTNLMIELCKEYNSHDKISVNFKYDSLKELYNRFNMCDDSVIICKDMSKVISELRQRSLLSIQGSGYEYYIEPHTRRKINEIEFDSYIEYEACESAMSMVRLDCDNVDYIDMRIIMSKDNNNEFIERYSL